MNKVRYSKEASNVNVTLITNIQNSVNVPLITNIQNSVNEESFNQKLHSLRKSNLHRVIFAQININSLRNIFDLLINSINGNIDILMISETKLDASFPLGQFLIEGFTSYILDGNDKGGGIIIFVREDIPSKLIFKSADIKFEAIFIEVNLRKKNGFSAFHIILIKTQ